MTLKVTDNQYDPLS